MQMEGKTRKLDYRMDVSKELLEALFLQIKENRFRFNHGDLCEMTFFENHNNCKMIMCYERDQFIYLIFNELDQILVRISIRDTMEKEFFELFWPGKFPNPINALYCLKMTDDPVGFNLRHYMNYKAYVKDRSILVYQFKEKTVTNIVTRDTYRYQFENSDYHNISRFIQNL